MHLKIEFLIWMSFFFLVCWLVGCWDQSYIEFKSVERQTKMSEISLTDEISKTHSLNAFEKWYALPIPMAIPMRPCIQRTDTQRTTHTHNFSDCFFFVLYFYPSLAFIFRYAFVQCSNVSKVRSWISSTNTCAMQWFDKPWRCIATELTQFNTRFRTFNKKC